MLNKQKTKPAGGEVSLKPLEGFRPEFARCIFRSDTDHLGYGIECRLGLWSVSGSDMDRVDREAYHYWQQYWRDGEYDELLSAKHGGDAPNAKKEKNQ